MDKRRGSETAHSVLDPTIAVDIGVLSQRQRIVEAMIDSCAEKTYVATTIADIVSRASISRTTFYKRFADKRECFDTALDHCVEKLQEEAAESHTGADSPADAVRKATVAILELLAARPAVAQLLMGEAVAVEPAVIDRYRRILIPALEGLWTAAAEPLQIHSDPRLAFGRVQVLIFNQIATDRTRELLRILPEIVYLTLLPFAGHEEAVRQARLAEPGANPDGSARHRDG
jgi:AcrR family transcriptional regulator